MGGPEHIYGRIPRRRIVIIAGDHAVLLPREAITIIDTMRGRQSAHGWIAATLLQRARVTMGIDLDAPYGWRDLAHLGGARR